MNVSLKEHLESLISQRFDAQEKAVQAALAAQKELTNAAFASSEKAITKAEEAQKSYNQTHNDLSRKMDEQYKEMMPRAESLARHASNEHRYQELKDDFSKLRIEFKDDLSKLRIELMKEIGSLRESRSESSGDKSGRLSQRELIGWIIGLLAAVIAIFFAVKR
jgi:hypothetical protein